jgi:hypothetical protein
MAKRSKRVIITLSDEEFEKCQAAADAQDRKIGPWFRWLGLQATSGVSKPQEPTVTYSFGGHRD